MMLKRHVRVLFSLLLSSTDLQPSPKTWKTRSMHCKVCFGGRCVPSVRHSKKFLKPPFPTPNPISAMVGLKKMFTQFQLLTWERLRVKQGLITVL